MATPRQLATFGEAANDSIYDVRRVVRHRESRDAKWRSPEWQRARNLVLERDQYACHFCQRQWPDAVRLEIHHWTPVRVAPHLWRSLRNLATLCQDCHRIETMKQAMQYGWRYLR